MAAAGAAATATAAHCERLPWAPVLPGRWPKPEGCLSRTSRPRLLKAADRRKVPDNPKLRYDLGLGWSCGGASARFESRLNTRAHLWSLGSRARQRAACEGST